LQIELIRITRNGHPERLLRLFGCSLSPLASRLKPHACFELFGFSPEGGTSLPLVRKPPDCGAEKPGYRVLQQRKFGQM